MNNHFKEMAKQNFNKARGKEFFHSILSLLRPEQRQLLSFEEVKKILKPTDENYLGLKTILVEKIVGSEGRYRDFNKNYLPKHDYLRNRWESIDRAHLQDVILPPIRLYEIGGVYFVRDGNHRVSVALSQGVQYIDAEIVTLNSVIGLTPDMSTEDIKKSVIDYEYQQFNKKTSFSTLFPGEEIRFSATGRYDDLIQHILVHKYYINEGKKKEIPFTEAFKSWFKNVYKPIIEIIKKHDVPSRFPGRTCSDLYIWCVRHWDDLKRKYGNDVNMQEAIQRFSAEHGKSKFERIKKFFIKLFKKKESPNKPG